VKLRSKQDQHSQEAKREGPVFKDWSNRRGKNTNNISTSVQALSTQRSIEQVDKFNTQIFQKSTTSQKVSS
jgi:hypothetical protein